MIDVKNFPLLGSITESFGEKQAKLGLTEFSGVWAYTPKKRLVKSPKTYVRDSGLVHALLGIETFDELLGHPVVGPSWEGFVIENLLAAAPSRTRASFYRTARGAEIDLLLELGGRHGTWAVEIKRGLAPKAEKGFHIALEDLQPNKAFLVYAGQDRYPKGDGIEAIGLRALAEELRGLG